MSDHAHFSGQDLAGEEDLKTHALDYHRFTLAVKWFGIHLVAVVTFLALWLATSAGFLRGLIAGVLVFAGGVYAMSHGLALSSEGESTKGADPAP